MPYSGKTSAVHFFIIWNVDLVYSYVKITTFPPVNILMVLCTGFLGYCVTWSQSFTSKMSVLIESILVFKP